MATPGEHKTVQARILHYAQEIGWTYVPARRSFAYALDLLERTSFTAKDAR
jgi:hypothetical protein